MNIFDTPHIMQFSPNLVYGAMHDLEICTCERPTKIEDGKIREILHRDAINDVVDRISDSDAMTPGILADLAKVFRRATKVTSRLRKLTSVDETDMCANSTLNHEYFLEARQPRKRKPTAA